MKDESQMGEREIFVAVFHEDGKVHRLGHAKIGKQIDDALKRISKRLKTNKTALVRQILESYVRFFEERQALGGEPKFFESEKTLEEWIGQRFDMNELQKELNGLNKMIQDNSKSPEVKFLSKQLVVISKMIQEVNKNYI